ncbi:TonB-dependent receptor plug domain-containing protein [Paludibacterium paludis]|uniref:TonB-dependent receptor n=1 Tax=Paludibacterium paludis TaxID=1225769 RepID=A0A918P082_9NEIS|nr:TonB-dependent receptor [Paludibacterium paludis]GGY10795.1 TonB-dependent receptor [Paludibacterium paludis]
MVYKRKTLVVAIALMGSGLASSSAWSAEAGTEKLERIEVVGSNIKRIQKEGPSPIETLKRADIEKTGASTVAELLLKLPSNTAGFSEQGAGLQSAPGTSSVGLHGLGPDNTLVLLNGRRMTGYGIAQGGFTNFVDLNSIPASAIERIEILKDGASAIYGSDAIAGVVNIVTRKNYQGIEGKIGYGTSSKSDGTETTSNLTIGVGDLETDRYNFLVTLDTYDRSKIAMKDRDFSKDSDTSSRGGIDARSPTGAIPSWFDKTDPYVDPDTGIQGAWKVFGNCPTTPVGGKCLFNANPHMNLMDKAERRGVLGEFNFKFSDTLSAFAEAAYTRNKDWSQIAPTPSSGRVPAGVAGNPVNKDSRFVWRLMGLGDRKTLITSDTYRALAGLRGSLSSWDWETALGYSRNDVDSASENFARISALDEAIANQQLSPFLPVDPAVMASLRYKPWTKGRSSITFWDFKLSNPEVAQLPGGAVGVAIGLEARRETGRTWSDAAAEVGDVIGQGGASMNANRNTRAAYIEVNIPVSKSFELQLAERYDYYNDFGGAFNPKVAFRWQPDSRVMLRGSYSTAFRAPSLQQLYTPGSTGYNNLRDPVRCPVVTTDNIYCGYSTPVTNGGNSKLQPEKSYNSSVGLVVEPFKWASLSIDYYRINKTNVIKSNDQYVLNNFPGLVTRNASGDIENIDSPYMNMGREVIRGIDSSLILRGDLGNLGKLTYTAGLNYLISDQIQDFTGGPLYENADLIGAVKTRMQHTVSWDIGPWSPSLTYNYIGGYKDYSHDNVTGHTVGAYDLFDVQLQYSGIKNARITAGVKNVANKKPPLSTFGNYASTGFNTDLYSAQGRFFYMNVGYKFK